MAIVNLRKETTERSGAANWAKKLLMAETDFHFEAIEGCNQNRQHTVTHLMERARVDMDGKGKSSAAQLLQAVTDLEGADSLRRKIAFARLFGLPLYYVLYSNEREIVYLLALPDPQTIQHVHTFRSFREFADFIARIKGWQSGKHFREMDDLPYFDKQLRRHGSSWPTNIDNFVTDRNGNPLGIIAFQDASDTGVRQHCNNDRFQCKQAYTRHGPYGPYTSYKDDISRWTSQEILRVQSGLRLFIITWAQNEQDYVLKELQHVAIPWFPESGGKPDWTAINAYKGKLHSYVSQNRPKNLEQEIAGKHRSFSLQRQGNRMVQIMHEPPLSYREQTFPALYYKAKTEVANDRRSLPPQFIQLVKRHGST